MPRAPERADDGTSSSTARSSLLRWAIRLALLGGLAGFALYRVDLAALGAHLDVHLLQALLAAQPFVILSFALFAVRLSYLLPADPGFRIAYNAFVLPIGSNLVLPGRLSELVKPVYLSTAGGIPLLEGGSAVVLERVLDVVVIGAVALIVLPAAYASPATTTAIVAAMAFAAALPWAARLTTRYLPKGDGRAVVLLRRGTAALGRIGGFGRYAILLGLTALGWGASIASVLVLMRVGGSIPLNVGQAGTLFVLTLIGGMIAVLPAGIGTFQAAAMVGLLSFGYSAEEGIVLAVLLQVSAIAYAVAHSIVVFWRGPMSLGALKAMLPWRRGNTEGL